MDYGGLVAVIVLEQDR